MAVGISEFLRSVTFAENIKWSTNYFCIYQVDRTLLRPWYLEAVLYRLPFWSLMTICLENFKLGTTKISPGRVWQMGCPMY